MAETVKNQVLEAVAGYQGDILEFTRQLISVATENPPGAFYKRCTETIEHKLTESGLECRIIEVPGGDRGGKPRYCLLSFYGTGGRTLYFHGHYDVVPAFSPKQFQPYLEGNNLFGRGSSDMKSGLAAMIYALKAIQACHIELNGQIGLTIVPDEETGSELGAKYLSEINVLGKNGIGMLLGEPTSGVVWNSSRGAISLRVAVKGKPAHVGLHHQGINAFEKMLIVADALLELKKEVETRRTVYYIEPDVARGSILAAAVSIWCPESVRLLSIGVSIRRRTSKKKRGG